MVTHSTSSYRDVYRLFCLYRSSHRLLRGSFRPRGLRWKNPRVPHLRLLAAGCQFTTHLLSSTPWENSQAAYNHEALGIKIAGFLLPFQSPHEPGGASRNTMSSSRSGQSWHGLCCPGSPSSTLWGRGRAPMDDEPWHGLGWQKAADSKIYSSFVLSENPEML